MSEQLILEKLKADLLACLRASTKDSEKYERLANRIESASRPRKRKKGEHLISVSTEIDVRDQARAVLEIILSFPIMSIALG